MKVSTSFLALLSLIRGVVSANPATVSLSNNTGTIGHLASGIILSIPDNGSQIPSHMYTDWGFNFARGGGPALPSPRGGWNKGRAQYEARMAEVMGNYQVAKTYGAKFICLVETLYGEWSVANGPYPGDSGNWTDWDAFTQAVISNLKSYNVNLNNFIIEIFNEVDGPWYWIRPQSQALEMWRRTYSAFRTAFGSAAIIQGPSASEEPKLSSSWWTNFTSYIKADNCVPDTWTWHMESGGGNMLESTGGFLALVKQYGLPYNNNNNNNNININEYAVALEQVPSGAVWWISQLERMNIPGLRGNWQGYPGLYDYLANLFSKTGAPSNDTPTSTGYFPNGEYQVYKYYARKMTGHRFGTTPTSDMAVDVYATLDTSAREIRVLAGSHHQTGTWTIQVQSLTSLGLAASGTVNITCLSFTGNGWWSEVDAPGSCGTYPSTSYSNNALNIILYQGDTSTAYAWEISY